MRRYNYEAHACNFISGKYSKLLVGAMSQTTYERVESVGRDIEITEEDIKNEELGID